MDLTEVHTTEITAEPLRSSINARVNAGSLQLALSELSKCFKEPFAVVDVESGDLVHSDFESLGCDFYEIVELLAEVSRHRKAEIVRDVAPLVMLAVPLGELGLGSHLVAVGVFVTSAVTDEQDLSAAAKEFGVDPSRAFRWSRGRTVWNASLVERMASLLLENLNLREQQNRLQGEVEDATAHTEDIYAELDLLHRLTSQLHLSESEEELWQNALGWLAQTIPAQCLSLIARESHESELSEEEPKRWRVFTEGESPADDQELCELIRRFGPLALRQPVVLNRAETMLPTWHCPTIRELVCVPIEGNEHPGGWLLALNHRGDAKAEFNEFGSVEIQLLSSVGTILGIHNSNLGLFREEAELFASSVQALTSAIDAKDRYTSGHSDRVAAFSVAIAEQMGLSKTELDTLHLAGLLHDIGKIGIDDHVLNKPGKLTSEEYEQIKQHPQLGYEILKGVRKLDQVLPMVLHHHEAWDGSGYPHGLQCDGIPKMARIMAVADAFDAMSSDRPYRKGMSDEEIDSILRSGSGTQWDPDVINAFFESRGRIQRIVEESLLATASPV